jgi:hypothetical protein
VPTVPSATGWRNSHRANLVPSNWHATCSPESRNGAQLACGTGPAALRPKWRGSRARRHPRGLTATLRPIEVRCWRAQPLHVARRRAAERLAIISRPARRAALTPRGAPGAR